jgi:hypothetical protein
MVSRPSFLTTPFGGYFHRDVPQEDAELTHVGPGTPWPPTFSGVRCCAIPMTKWCSTQRSAEGLRQ